MEENSMPHGGGNIYNYFEGAHIGKVVYNYGTITFYENKEEKRREGYTDEEVAQALANIIGKGKPIDTKAKWTGALWMLKWECNYPAKAQEFCERIKKLPLPTGLEFPCEYENIRKTATLSFLNEDPRQMDKVKYSKNDEQDFFQMKTVAIALKQELKKNRETFG